MKGKDKQKPKQKAPANKWPSWYDYCDTFSESPTPWL